MIYLICTGKIEGRIILVKDYSKAAALNRFNLKGDERIISVLTDGQFERLNDSKDGVIYA